MATENITIKGSEGEVKGVIETGAREGGDFFAKLTITDNEPNEALFVTADDEKTAGDLLKDLITLAVKYGAI